METLKKLKKHDHTLTDIIKAFIFFIVLLAPFLAVLTKCVYVACNKNAYQSYTGTNSNEYELVNFTNFSINKKYLYYSTTTGENLVSNNNQEITFNQFELLSTSNSIDYQWIDTNEIVKIKFNNNSNTNIYITLTTKSNETRNINLRTNSLSFNFVYREGNISDTYVHGLFKLYLYNDYYYLDNVFYYAVDEMKDSELFGWTKDTAIYTGVNAMCSGLAVQDGALPVLITYWTLTTAIYIILDIVIFAFKKITHFLQ